MKLEEPILAVLLLSLLAAGSAALGALPFLGGRRPARIWIGAAYAVAGGAMLGAGYLLMSRALEQGTLGVVLGAALGVLYSRWVQGYAEIDDLKRDPPTEGHAPDFGYKVLLQDTLHSSAEGLAIGVAFALELSLGIFLALALAVHNIGEAMALSDVLHRRGMKPMDCAGLAIITNVPQPLLAIVGFALAPALAGIFPGMLGFAAGALVYLVLTDLLPASYRRADDRIVAFLVSAAAGAVVLLEAVVGGGGA